MQIILIIYVYWISLTIHLRKGLTNLWIRTTFPWVIIDIPLDSEYTPACACVCTHARPSSFRSEPQTPDIYSYKLLTWCDKASKGRSFRWLKLCWDRQFKPQKSHLILAITVFMPTQTSYAENNILYIHSFFFSAKGTLTSSAREYTEVHKPQQAVFTETDWT